MRINLDQAHKTVTEYMDWPIEKSYTTNDLFKVVFKIKEETKFSFSLTLFPDGANSVFYHEKKYDKIRYGSGSMEISMLVCCAMMIEKINNDPFSIIVG